jgi:hypothetical protein
MLSTAFRLLRPVALCLGANPIAIRRRAERSSTAVAWRFRTPACLCRRNWALVSSQISRQAGHLTRPPCLTLIRYMDGRRSYPA